MNRASILLTGMLAATVANPLTAQESHAIDALPTLAGTEHIVHTSPRLDRPFHIFIKRSDAAPPDAVDLPVVYVLDAEQAFPLLASYSWSLTFSEEMPPSIIVGIGYGSVERGVNMRGTDYTVPSPTREDAGGAAVFAEVLREEIIPLVEAEIGHTPSRRTIVGQSLGGHFVLYQALEHPGLFDLGIAINPAIHNSPDWFAEKLASLESTSDQRLYISLADNDVPRFGDPAKAWVRQLAGRPSLPWCLRIDRLEDHGHLTSMPRAFRNAMRWSHSETAGCGEIAPELLE